MSSSEKNVSQDDSDVDIYKDFDEFNFEDELTKLEGSKEIYRQEALDLSEKLKKLTEENEDLKKSNEVLKKNLSVLLKTAKAEVQRKDSIISELRVKVDSFAFRRNSKSTKEKYTETEESEFSIVSNCKCMIEKKRSKSHESKSSSDTCKYFQDDKKREFTGTKEEDLASETNKWTDCYRDRKKNYKHFESSYKAYSHERFKDNSFCRCRERHCVDSRRSFRHNFRDHLKYDSLDKKRHSDEYHFSARHSRERREHSKERREVRREESPNKQRKKDVRKNQSHFKEHSSQYNDACLSKINSKSSGELVSRKKEESNNKNESSKFNSVFNENTKTEKTSENKKGSTSGKIQDEKNLNYKNALKNEKKVDCKLFNAISPLEALYSEPARNRDTNRSSNLGIALLKSEVEEGEYSVNKFPDEQDWTLSFKNERKNENRSMTLYSKRMLKKLAVESAEIEKPKCNEKTEIKHSEEVENKLINVEILPKNVELEKEPGELTDDENIVESSKEFQELTKVASIEIKNNNTPEKTEEKGKSERVPERKNENHLELNKHSSKNLSNEEEPKGKDQKEIEMSKGTSEVIEFSPFKRNYKLIEISPIKPSGGERLLDYFSKKIVQPQKDSESYNVNLISPLSISKELSDSKEKIESDESILKTDDSFRGKELSEEKIDSNIQTPSKSLMKVLEKEERNIETRSEKNRCDSKRNKEKANEKSIIDVNKKKVTEDAFENKSEIEENSTKKENGKPKQEKVNKRKRVESECSEDAAHKKQKTKKVESDEFSTQVHENLEPENASNEKEEKVKEDISFFEFFKPITNKEKGEELSVSTSADYKMTTTMSLTGVVCLETPNKRVEKLKNLMINEQMIYSVNVDSKTGPFSPLMTPRRMLRNDLMLTDSEDDSAVKITKENEEEDVDDYLSESSSNSDSGASDFVDLL